MRCAWQELLEIIPLKIGRELRTDDTEYLTEIRMRIGCPPELVSGVDSRFLVEQTTREDLHYCINAASKYSPWASESMSRGYLTAAGGHRIGICGQAVVQNGVVIGVKSIQSLCIRVARDYSGIAKRVLNYTGSVLIIGPPGRGKTTLLRDTIRQISNAGTHISVIDERGELFPGGYFQTGRRTDVLTGCLKPVGINMALRCMGPEAIAVDEITEAEDAQALVRAAWCGVRLLATAHCSSKEDLYKRSVYRPLIDSEVFHTLIVIQKDKSWRAERMVHR